MSNCSEPSAADDPYDLDRFVKSQEQCYSRALAEIKGGRKRTHWMWYIFPQVNGLGASSTSKYYAIKSVQEASAYLDHPILGARLRECAEAAISADARFVSDIFDSPDDLKLKSCATLFAVVDAPGSVFERLLHRYYWGEKDGRTLEILRRNLGFSTDR